MNGNLHNLPFIRRISTHYFIQFIIDIYYIVVIKSTRFPHFNAIIYIYIHRSVYILRKVQRRASTFFVGVLFISETKFSLRIANSKFYYS